jgi:hypothetical protein
VERGRPREVQMAGVRSTREPSVGEEASISAEVRPCDEPRGRRGGEEGRPRVRRFVLDDLHRFDPGGQKKNKAALRIQKPPCDLACRRTGKTGEQAEAARPQRRGAGGDAGSSQKYNIRSSRPADSAFATA